mmetsp:Transcript_117983/g.333723  ORF Transcript_117983/g.333723 Transcript_117983/m.333723 type:complete len:339 (-) Transcript_117983:295-1311(-)
MGLLVVQVAVGRAAAAEAIQTRRLADRGEREEGLEAARWHVPAQRGETGHRSMQVPLLLATHEARRVAHEAAVGLEPREGRSVLFRLSRVPRLWLENERAVAAWPRAPEFARLVRCRAEKHVFKSLAVVQSHQLDKVHVRLATEVGKESRAGQAVHSDDRVVPVDLRPQAPPHERLRRPHDGASVQACRDRRQRYFTSISGDRVPNRRWDRPGPRQSAPSKRRDRPGPRWSAARRGDRVHSGRWDRPGLRSWTSRSGDCAPSSRWDTLGARLRASDAARRLARITANLDVQLHWTARRCAVRSLAEPRRNVQFRVLFPARPIAQERRGALGRRIYTPN